MNEVIKIVTAHPTVRKATAAFTATLLGALGTSLIDGIITGPEVGMSFGAALVATAAVWKTTNKEATA